MSRGFNPDLYDTVESRIGKFWADHPQGRVLTELLFRDDKQYIVRADVYTDRDDARPAATGYAEEVVGSSPVNKTSALENCETSAIGRALANLNYAAKARPSQTEMGKEQRQADRARPAEQDTVPAARAVLANRAKAQQVPIERIEAAYQALARTDITAETDPARIRKFLAHLDADGGHRWAELAAGRELATNGTAS